MKTEFEARVIMVQHEAARLYRLARYELEAGGHGPASLQRAKSLQKKAAREARHARRLHAHMLPFVYT